MFHKHFIIYWITYPVFYLNLKYPLQGIKIYLNVIKRYESKNRVQKTLKLNYKHKSKIWRWLYRDFWKMFLPQYK